MRHNKIQTLEIPKVKNPAIKYKIAFEGTLNWNDALAGSDSTFDSLFRELLRGMFCGANAKTTLKSRLFKYISGRVFSSVEHWFDNAEIVYLEVPDECEQIFAKFVGEKENKEKAEKLIELEEAEKKAARLLLQL